MTFLPWSGITPTQDWGLSQLALTGDYAHRSCRFAVGTVASKHMDRLATFLSHPVVTKK
jgi:hypothetical protein